MDINRYTPYRKGTDRIFTSEEKRCKHIGNNPNGHNIRQFKVDEEIFSKNDPSERCDYLLLNDTDSRAYYIELKGSDIEKAIRQIENSIKILHDGISTYTIYRRIVYHSGTIDLQSNAVIRWKKKCQGRAVIRSRKMEEDVS